MRGCGGEVSGVTIAIQITSGVSFLGLYQKIGKITGGNPKIAKNPFNFCTFFVKSPYRIGLNCGMGYCERFSLESRASSVFRQ